MHVLHATPAISLPPPRHCPRRLPSSLYPCPFSPQVVDAVLLSQGSASGGAFFLGGHYSIAEVLTTSLLQRALVYLPAYRGVDVWGLVREQGLQRLEAWMTAALERPSGGCWWVLAGALVGWLMG